jgi:hypothetical protein
LKEGGKLYTYLMKRRNYILSNLDLNIVDPYELKKKVKKLKSDFLKTDEYDENDIYYLYNKENPNTISKANSEFNSNLNKTMKQIEQTLTEEISLIQDIKKDNKIINLSLTSLGFKNLKTSIKEKTSSPNINNNKSVNNNNKRSSTSLTNKLSPFSRFLDYKGDGNENDSMPSSPFNKFLDHSESEKKLKPLHVPMHESRHGSSKKLDSNINYHYIENTINEHYMTLNQMMTPDKMEAYKKNILNLIKKNYMLQKRVARHTVINNVLNMTEEPKDDCSILDKQINQIKYINTKLKYFINEMK